MDTNPADTILHLVAKITAAIEFPVGDAEFDAALDDCLAALAGSPSPAEDRAHAERALRGLLGQTDRLGLPVPKNLRDESLCALAAGKPHAASMPGASSTSRGSAGRTGARAVDNFLLDLH